MAKCLVLLLPFILFLLYPSFFLPFSPPPLLFSFLYSLPLLFSSLSKDVKIKWSSKTVTDFLLINQSILRNRTLFTEGVKMSRKLHLGWRGKKRYYLIGFLQVILKIIFLIPDYFPYRWWRTRTSDGSCRLWKATFQWCPLSREGKLQIT